MSQFYDENDTARYKRSLMDRLGPDIGSVFRTMGYAIQTFGLLITLGIVLGAAFKFPMLYWIALIPATALISALVGMIGMGGSMLAGAGFKTFIAPSGSSTPYQKTFSHQEALAARGDIAGALESYEALIETSPGDIEVRVAAAELYARAKHANRARAAELYREVRSMEGISVQREIYVSSRLVDLYRGPLADPGRALVELRRLVDRHPTSVEAKHARVAISRIKQEMADASGA